MVRYAAAAGHPTRHKPRLTAAAGTVRAFSRGVSELELSGVRGGLLCGVLTTSGAFAGRPLGYLTGPLGIAYRHQVGAKLLGMAVVGGLVWLATSACHGH